ncbi:MAG: PLP-dependent aspartate aminotransferase family protein [Halobacteriales archaeon]
MDEESMPGFDTLAVSHGEKLDQRTDDAGGAVAPIQLASTFALEGLDFEKSLEEFDPAQGEYLYSRLANPTRQALEERLAALEGGEHAFAYASGTSAVATTALATLEPGDHMVAFDDLYGGTRRLFEELLADRLDIDVSFVDARDPDNVVDALTDRTRLVWMETPTNPILRLCDVEAIAERIPEKAKLGVDNTFASPAFQRPLELGADVVAHSTTKYLNGHSDSLGGAVITDDDGLAEQMGFLQRVGLGNVLSPFDSYMVLRGIKTLPLRMQRHEANATVLAEYLQEHEMVRTVNYPGLESHSQHDLARRQMDGYGGVLSFELQGSMDDAKTFLEALEEFTLAVSLGGVESLVELPAAMTHEPIPREQRQAIGIADTLIRISAGVEDPADLLADLETGFEAVAADRQATTADD